MSDDIILPPNSKAIPLTQDKFTIVDAEDYDWLMQYKWHYGARGYAIRNTNQSKKLHESGRMHRVIMNAPDNVRIDHINGNPLDNRKNNLRFCTQQQNVWNQKKTRGSSKYRGVWFDKKRNKWAYLFIKDKVKIARGRCDSEVDAAIKWNNLAKEHYGEFAKLNEVHND